MFQVASDSMAPTMTVNDVILVRINADFEVNDIISFNDEDAIVTHRVISIIDKEIYAQGDANNVIDAPITEDQVIGRVVRILPNLRIWQQIFTDPKILAGLFITLILFDFAFSYKGKNNQSQGSIIERFLPKRDKVDNKDSVVEKKLPKKETEDNTIEIVQIELRDVDELLSMTEVLDLSDIIKKDKKDIKKMDLKKLFSNQKHLEKLNKKIKKVPDSEKLEYTIRLDLKEIQKEINKKMKG